jgi:acyl dehydratase/NAD(P)-dependent dehydrogenase (short-subunit alcohol dehydrogenase family)
VPAHPDAEVLERELRFTPHDMELFAAASGDRSPLHTDPAFARRTSFGECIVYGGLVSIGMLGLLPVEVRARVRSVRSVFTGAVMPGALTTARAQRRRDRPSEWEIRLTGRGKVLARVIASTSDEVPGQLDRADILARAARGAAAPPPEIGGLTPGRELAGSYRTGSELSELARRFGADGVDPGVLAGIAWASCVVGMTIPDFDGLCAAVTIVSQGLGDGPDAVPARRWVRLREYDQRTDRLVIEGLLADEAGSALALGLIECFPFSPTPLPDSAALTSTGAPERGRVVVIGASRGAGAALTLALLGHGYRVDAVYSSSTTAAAELTRLAGPYEPRLSLHRLDAGDAPSMSALASTVAEPIEGLALCAAPPPLPMGLTAESAVDLVGYVSLSTRLSAVPLGAFLPLLGRDRSWVLFCSAPAADDPHRDLPQLTVAKAALEGLARWAVLAAPRTRTVVARPPKMRTDLVNTPGGRLAAAPPEAVMSAIVEQLAAEDLTPGLSILAPDPAELSAR